MSRQAVLAVGCVIAVSSMHGAVAQEPAGGEPVRSGTVIEFHGWSPDSQFVAYTRTRRTLAGKKKGKVRLGRRSLHRRVKDGRFQGTGPVASDVHVPRYAERRGYITPELDRLEVNDNETWFVALEGTYKLRLSIGEVLAWELSFEDEVIERRAFDTIYVRCDARIYPSPDRSAAVLVMHLDRGWTVDGAVYPLSLPGHVQQAWAKLQGELTP
ncbi:MAG: hypothetical protein QF464_15010 [Myxococcota bacterium]|nr:hypothetical protein [Myxococcota bacterium]